MGDYMILPTLEDAMRGDDAQQDVQILGEYAQKNQFADCNCTIFYSMIKATLGQHTPKIHDRILEHIDQCDICYDDFTRLEAKRYKPNTIKDMDEHFCDEYATLALVLYERAIRGNQLTVSHSLHAHTKNCSTCSKCPQPCVILTAISTAVYTPQFNLPRLSDFIIKHMGHCPECHMILRRAHNVMAIEA